MLLVTSLKDKKFEALKNKWYKKLKQSGFDDIENKNGDLKKYEATYWKRKAQYTTESQMQTGEAKETYFRLAGHFLHDFSFESVEDKEIWKRHSAGETIDAISATTKSVSRYKIYKIIVGLRTKMLKMYSEDL